MRILIVAAAAALSLAPAAARDLGQWGGQDAAITKWFQGLMQPDNPRVSCCGESDAYFADSFEVEGDHYVAIITDERPDGPLKRPHIDVGTRIVVPNYKMKFDDGNPTGHGVIFMRAGDGFVFCYIQPGGV